MHFSTLAEADLALSRDDIMRVMAPFVQRHVVGDDAEWDAIVRKRKKSILRRNVRRMTLGWLPQHQRRPASIIDEYTQVWRVGYGSYDPANPPARYRPWHWGEERLLANDFGAARFRQLMLVRLIERLKPRSVLEVGCGLAVAGQTDHRRSVRIPHLRQHVLEHPVVAGLGNGGMESLVQGYPRRQILRTEQRRHDVFHRRELLRGPALGGPPGGRDLDARA